MQGGRRSPKKKSVVTEPFQEAPTAAATFDEIINREYAGDTAAVAGAATRSDAMAVRRPDAWAHEDAEDCDPMAEDDHTPQDDWEETVASTPTSQLAAPAAAPAPSMASPGSDANTDEFMAYLDRDDDLPEPAMPPAPAGRAVSSVPNPEVELLKARLEHIEVRKHVAAARSFSLHSASLCADRSCS